MATCSFRQPPRSAVESTLGLTGRQRQRALLNDASWNKRLMKTAIRRVNWMWVPLAIMLSSCGGSGGAASPDQGTTSPPTAQELQCQTAGWLREVVSSAGLQRLVLWKSPAVWTRGAIVIMHGGGGSHTNFCVANLPLIAPQVRFTEMALAHGFAVFLVDSSDQVRDNQDRICGKVWDDEVRRRPNLDLPFFEEVARRLIPIKRPAGSRRRSDAITCSAAT